MRFVKITALVLIVLAGIAGSAWLYLTARTAVPETSDYAFDLAEIRRLAGTLPGPAPLRVNAELVAHAEIPRGGVFAGEPFEPHPMVHQSFQIVFPDRFLLLDAGFDAAMHAKMLERSGPGPPYFPDAYARVQAALAAADAIYITHEHGDHLQGIARFTPPEALLGRLRLTPEQLGNTLRMDQVAMPQVLRDAEPFAYETYAAVAPGVVMIKAAGHTPGAHLMYVRLADGRELLFIGDTAWHMDAIRKLHYRPRLITDHFINEDRAALLDQFRTLHDLDRAHPEVRIVASHDADQRAKHAEEGLIGTGFE